MKKAEIEEIQILRGMAFLAVMLQHVLAVFGGYPELQKGDGIFFSIFLTLSRFAVPMFVFITGMVLFYNYYGEIKYGSFIIKRAKDILLPYFAWSIIFFLLFSYNAALPLAKQTENFIGMLFHGTSAYHLWYIVMIFQFYLFLPLFFLIISKKREWTFNVLILIGLFIVYIQLMKYSAFTLPVIYESIKSPILRDFVDFRDRNFILWFFYFIMGAFAGIHLDKWKSLTNKLKNFNFILYIFFTIFIVCKLIETLELNTAGTGYKINFNVSAPLNPYMAGYAVIAIIVLYYFAEIICRKKGMLYKTIYEFGNLSLGGYLVHPLIITALGLFLIPKLGFINSLSIKMTVDFILTSALTIFATMLIAKLPYHQIFIGKTKRKKVGNEG